MKNNSGSTLVEAFGVLLLLQLLFAGAFLLFAVATAQLAAHTILEKGLVSALAGQPIQKCKIQMTHRLQKWTPWLQIESLQIHTSMNTQLRKEAKGRVKWCIRWYCNKTKKQISRTVSEKRIKALRL